MLKAIIVFAIFAITWPLSLLRIEASIAVAAQVNGCVG
jgi:hypothetical protein